MLLDQFFSLEKDLTNRQIYETIFPYRTFSSVRNQRKKIKKANINEDN